MTVWTGDVRGAGTDANVFLQMYGEYGKSETFQLRNRTDNFEQNQMDKFKVKGICLCILPGRMISPEVEGQAMIKSPGREKIDCPSPQK